MNNEYLAIIEGMIFIAGDQGINLNDIAKNLKLNASEVEKYLQNLKNTMNDNDSRGLILLQIENNYKFTTKKEHHQYYFAYVNKQNNNLSSAALETLAIIAYKGPITKNEIEQIRGVSSDSIVNRLKSQELITDIGRSDKPGKPILYKVTQNFLDYFNLESIKHLPPLPEQEKIISEQELYSKN